MLTHNKDRVVNPRPSGVPRVHDNTCATMHCLVAAKLPTSTAIRRIGQNALQRSEFVVLFRLLVACS
jgi:hypothetical protein